MFVFPSRIVLRKFCQQNNFLVRPCARQRAIHCLSKVSKKSYSEEKGVLLYSSHIIIQHDHKKLIDNLSIDLNQNQVGECWKCGTPLDGQKVVCGTESTKSTLSNGKNGCGAIQRIAADNVNFFQLFNLPTSYSLDDKTLEMAYKSLQKQLHPDKFAKACNEEKDISTEASALVNHAYSTLRSPLDRAEYMLWLLFRQKVYESEATRMDPGLMAEMFEWREKVDDAKTDTAQRKTLIADVAQELSHCENDLKALFSAKLEVNSAEKIAMTTTKFKYFSKMMQELQESEDKDH